jgi:hypothetical protein
MTTREYPGAFDEIVDEPEANIPFNGGGKTKRQIPLVAFDDIKLTAKPQYLVKGLVPRVGLTVAWGPPKCGKSFWAFDLGMHVAIGLVYRGRRVQQGAVVYGAFESPEGFKARAEAFRKCRLADHRKPIPFYLVPMTLDLVRDHIDLIAAVKRTLGKVSPGLVVLDTLNRSIRGSESDDKDMTAYIRAADAIREAFGCAVLIVHHCGVNESRPRGHTSLTGAADAQLAVKRDAVDNVVVTVEHMKDGCEGDAVVSKLEKVEIGIDDDGGIISSCVVVPVAGEAIQTKSRKPAPMPKAAQTALRALHKAIDEGGTVPPASNHIPPNIRIAAVEQWREYAYKTGISDSGQPRARQQAFKRAYDYLVGAGHAAVWNDQAWPTQVPQRAGEQHHE